jgi:hypothetical protein
MFLLLVSKWKATTSIKNNIIMENKNVSKCHVCFSFARYVRREVRNHSCSLIDHVNHTSNSSSTSP